jgi:hypothetical protein
LTLHLWLPPYGGAWGIIKFGPVGPTSNSLGKGEEEEEEKTGEIMLLFLQSICNIFYAIMIV